MRTTVNLSEPLLQSAKRRAAERGVTLGTFLEEVLRMHLARETSTHAQPFELHTVTGRLVRPDLDLDRTSAFDVLEDEEKFAGLERR